MTDCTSKDQVTLGFQHLQEALQQAQIKFDVLVKLQETLCVAMKDQQSVNETCVQREKHEQEQQRAQEAQKLHACELIMTLLDCTCEQTRKKMNVGNSSFLPSCLNPGQYTTHIQNNQVQFDYMMVNHRVYIKGEHLLGFLECVKQYQPNIPFNEFFKQFGLELKQYKFGTNGYFINREAWIHCWSRFCEKHNINGISINDTQVLSAICQLYTLVV